MEEALLIYKHVVDVLRAQVIELYGDNGEDAVSAMLPPNSYICRPCLRSVQRLLLKLRSEAQKFNNSIGINR